MIPLEKLKKTLIEANCDAILLPGTDPHQSEYPPAMWQLRQHFTGFTGSAGHVICTRKRTLLTTDSRYSLQAPKEIDPSMVDYRIIARNLSFETEVNWAKEQMKDFKTLAVDPRLITMGQYQKLSSLATKLDFQILLVDDKFLEKAWPNRPSRPLSPIKLRKPGIDSQSREEKIEKIQNFLKDKGADLHVMADLESIARSLNFIGFDAGYDLLAVSYLIVDLEKSYLYIDSEKVAGINLGPKVCIKSYDNFLSDLNALSKDKTVILDTSDATAYIKNGISSSARILLDRSPSLDIRQVKTKSEIEHILKAHINDAVALAEAFSQLYQILETSSISEYDLGLLIDAERAKRPQFIANSFPPIVGYLDNGAIVHYRAPKKGSALINKRGIVLIDSGGHYENGTTDITRTLCLGEVSDEMIKRYTQVLKGHMNINRSIFPKGTSPSHIEMLARQPLLADQLEYGHGTGHGVGYGTAVHESSEASLSKNNLKPFQEGWVVSNEPGIYLENAFGIRIENLVAVEAKSESLFSFKQLTMFPYEIDLIDTRQLTNDEITWINSYHDKVFELLKDQVSDRAKSWLERRCQPLDLHKH